MQSHTAKETLPPCVLALLVEVSTLDRGGGQFPMGHSRMQHPVATLASSPPFRGRRRPRLLRLRRHHPHLSRSSSPELSHPSNWPSSGGASPMGYHHLLATRASRRSHRPSSKSRQISSLPRTSATRSASESTKYPPPLLRNRRIAAEILSPHETQLLRQIPSNHSNLQTPANHPRRTTASPPGTPPPPRSRAQDHRMKHPPRNRSKRRGSPGRGGPPFYSSPAAASAAQQQAAARGREGEREREEWGIIISERIMDGLRREGEGERERDRAAEEKHRCSSPLFSFREHVADVDGFSSVRLHGPAARPTRPTTCALTWPAALRNGTETGLCLAFQNWWQCHD